MENRHFIQKVADKQKQFWKLSLQWKVYIENCLQHNFHPTMGLVILLYCYVWQTKLFSPRKSGCTSISFPFPATYYLQLIFHCTGPSERRTLSRDMGQLGTHTEIGTRIGTEDCFHSNKYKWSYKNGPTRQLGHHMTTFKITFKFFHLMFFIFLISIFHDSWCLMRDAWCLRGGVIILKRENLEQYIFIYLVQFQEDSTWS